jgi:hypothetical protein
MIACGGVVKNGIHGSLGAQNAVAALAHNRIRRFGASLLCVVSSDTSLNEFLMPKDRSCSVNLALKSWAAGP